MPEHITGLSHASFFCNTPQQFREMLDFYTDKLGFAPQFTLSFDENIIGVYRSMGYTVSAQPGDVWIAYLKVAERQFVELFNMGGVFGAGHSFKHVCYLVDDLKQAAAELLEKGVCVREKLGPSGKPYELGREYEPGACGSYICFIQDPAGNEIELMQYTPQSKQLGG